MRKPIDEHAWARHAFAANGFGGDVLPYDIAPARAAPPAVMLEPPAPHPFMRASLRGLREALRRLAERYRHWRDARATYDALRQLDDRALHDLGFDRSEIASIAREATGYADYTRAHPLVSCHDILR